LVRQQHAKVVPGQGTLVIEGQCGRASLARRRNIALHRSQRCQVIADLGQQVQVGGWFEVLVQAARFRVLPAFGQLTGPLVLRLGAGYGAGIHRATVFRQWRTFPLLSLGHDSFDSQQGPSRTPRFPSSPTQALGLWQTCAQSPRKEPERGSLRRQKEIKGWKNGACHLGLVRLESLQTKQLPSERVA
jgi:hypothetical protein